MKTRIIRTIAIFALTVCGILIGVAIALAAAQVLGQLCAGDSACQAGFYGLIGGIALTQGLNLIVIVALWQRRRRSKRESRS